jgi:mannose-6-phosphate isomerase-like protein (cupin superfamily)
MKKLIYTCFFLSMGTFLKAQNTVHSPEPQPAPKLTLSEVMAKIPGNQGERYALGMKHGTMSVLVYAPKGTDEQTPHRQDEVYIVISGKGTFECGKDKVTFVPTDLLYVPAGVTHRFVDFSDDLVVWVVFYGKDGGEK